MNNRLPTWNVANVKIYIWWLEKCEMESGDDWQVFGPILQDNSHFGRCNGDIFNSHRYTYDSFVKANLHHGITRIGDCQVHD